MPDPVTVMDNRERGTQLPLIPTRDIIIFPYMVVPLFLGRQKSIKGLEEAVAKKNLVFLAAQRDPRVNDPTAEDIYPVGTLTSVAQLLRLPDGTVKVLVEGKRRGRILRYIESADFFLVEVEEVRESWERTGEAEVLIRNVKSTFENYVRLNKKVPPEMIASVAAIDDPAQLADTIIVHLGIGLEDKQALLETFDPVERLEKVLGYMRSEIEILEVEQRIRQRERPSTVAQDIMSILQPYVEGWAARDINLILDSVTEDFVFDERPMTMTEPVQNKQQFQEYLTKLFAAFPDFTLTAENVAMGEGQAWAEWTMSGTHQGEFLGIPPTNRRIEVRGASVFLAREGKVAQERLYWDTAHLLRQLGKLSY